LAVAAVVELVTAVPHQAKEQTVVVVVVLVVT
jgi:hypothetical protein